jgi:hypothetical protein
MSGAETEARVAQAIDVNPFGPQMVTDPYPTYTAVERGWGWGLPLSPPSPSPWQSRTACHPGSSPGPRSRARPPDAPSPGQRA